MLLPLLQLLQAPVAAEAAGPPCGRVCRGGAAAWTPRPFRSASAHATANRDGRAGYAELLGCITRVRRQA